jgi:hypothetical protein
MQKRFKIIRFGGLKVTPFLGLKYNFTFGVNLTLILELKSNPYSGVK